MVGLRDKVRRAWRTLRPFSSRAYWEDRYRRGGSSGAGSYNELAEFKARVLNQLVSESAVERVIEFGCGDGSQLMLAKYPSYIGYDVSRTAIAMCRERHGQDPTKSFALVSEYDGRRAALTLSLDVIYHLVEDSVFDDYMRRLFDASTQHVVVYASNKDASSPKKHVRHRKFTDWVNEHAAEFTLEKMIPNEHAGWENTGHNSFADFYIFRRR